MFDIVMGIIIFTSTINAKSKFFLVETGTKDENQHQKQPQTIEEEPPLMPEESSLTHDEESPLTSEEPPFTPEEPLLIPEEPPLVTQEPSLTTEEPPLTPEQSENSEEDKKKLKDVTPGSPEPEPEQPEPTKNEPPEPEPELLEPKESEPQGSKLPEPELPEPTNFEPQKIEPELEERIKNQLEELEPVKQIPDNIFEGSKEGAGVGVGEGAGVGVGVGAGVGVEEGAGVGVGEGTEVGAGVGAGAGNETGAGFGFGEGAGFGVGAGNEKGAGFGFGEGAGVGAGEGNEKGAGFGFGEGAGVGAGAGAGVGAGIGAGVGAGIDTGAGVGFGVGAGQKKKENSCGCARMKEPSSNNNKKNDYGKDYMDYIVEGSIVNEPRPWLALITTSEKPSKVLKAASRCGGSLINKRYVLTASHCVCHGPDLENEKGHKNNLACVEGGKDSGKLLYDPKFHHWVILGKNLDTKSILAFDGTDQLYGVESVAQHPLWRMAHMPFDIALMRLDRDVTFKKNYIMPICLPLNDNNRYMDSSKAAYSSGWGYIREHCTTNEWGPVQHIKCKIKDDKAKAACSKTPPPYKKDGLCAEFKKIHQDKYPQKMTSSIRIIDKTKTNIMNEEQCFADVPGPMGWCDTFLDEKQYKNWGWCNPSVCNEKKKMADTLREIKLNLLPLKECVYIISWNNRTRQNDDEFDANNEICAGRKTEFPYLQTYVKIRNKKTRKTEYRNVKGGGKINKGLLENQNWDLNYFLGGGDTCGGDSGGPLYAWVDRVATLLGVVSRGSGYGPRNLALGFGCGEFNYPGAYTRITKYLNWIHENSKDGNC